MAAAAAESKAQYSAILLGATGNVGGRIVQLLIKNPRCKKVVVVTRRKTDAFADPKVSEVVVNMDRLDDARFARDFDHSAGKNAIVLRYPGLVLLRETECCRNQRAGSKPTAV